MLAGIVNEFREEGTQHEKVALTPLLCVSTAAAKALPLRTTQYADDPPVQLIVIPLDRVKPLPLLKRRD